MGVDHVVMPTDRCGLCVKGIGHGSAMQVMHLKHMSIVCASWHTSAASIITCGLHLVAGCYWASVHYTRRPVMWCVMLTATQVDSIAVTEG